MASGIKIDWDDTVLPFQLDRSGIRGRVVRLDGALDQILKQHDYPEEIEALVAELVLLTVLMGQSIKLRWKLSLQVRGKGAARIIATDYYAPQAEGEPARIRAYASVDKEKLVKTSNPFELIGEGYLAVMMDQGTGMLPYQGFTPIAGKSLADCAEAYFAQSEQLPTSFQLAFGKSQLPGGALDWRAGGVMLQHMPKIGGLTVAEAIDQAKSGTTEIGKGDADATSDAEAHAGILAGEVAEDWNRANMLLRTVEELELIGPSVAPTDLLIRLFHEEEPRVFDPQSVHFGCSCSEEKVRNTLSIYSQKDIAHMTNAEGKVTADCQFCGAHYELDPKTVGFEGTNAAQ